MLRFRLTLPSGFSRDFKRRARRFWDVEGEVVGALLSFERPLTLAQVREAYERRYGRYPDGDAGLDRDLAYALLRLAEHGFVRIEPAVSLPPNVPTPLAFHLAMPRPATAAAGAAWRAYGQIAGTVLAAGSPMTLDQIVTAGRPPAARRDSPPAVTPAAVAHSLLALAGAGIVEVLQGDLGIR